MEDSSFGVSFFMGGFVSLCAVCSAAFTLVNFG